MVASQSRQGMELQAQLRPELRALPGVLQTLGMLTMTHQEVVEATERCLAENPVLERADGHPCPGCGRHVSSGICHRCRSRGPSAEFHDGTEAGTDPFRTIEADAGVAVRSECRHALSLVVAHLTGRGLLDADISEIARLHGLATADVNEALRALRVVGPPGIGARDIVGLLTAQAEALVQARQAPGWLPRLVRDHLPDLAEGHLEDTAEMMGISEEEVTDGLAIIRARLRPFVVVEMSPIDTPELSADVFLYSNPDGSIEVEVPTSSWFGLRAVDLAAGLGNVPEARQWLAGHELAARQLIRQVDGRADVLLRVTRFAVAHQSGFLEHGPGHHRALTRTAVAKELGVHPSTVSRAVRGKRLRLPPGEVVDLSCLFGKGVAARTTLQGLISNHGANVSDAALRNELSRQGFDIARRTVAKYRHALPADPTASPRQPH